jgi:nitroimidazol reductase NimA-like FMN-containing flavoprotein (pyridoxamine 5'-phosphate oxidase superfamily)
MFREIRAENKKLDNEEMLEVLDKAEYGVLSTIGEDGYLYGVPVNFVYEDRKIYFHGAVEGHKADNLGYSDKASFCAIVDVELLPDEFNTKYRSVIAFGKIKEVAGEEKKKVFMMILEKFSNEFLESGKKYVMAAGHEARVYCMDVEHMTAKGKK